MTVYIKFHYVRVKMSKYLFKAFVFLITDVVFEIGRVPLLII